MKNEEKNQKKSIKSKTPSAVPIMSQPETVFELINKYGTYNIQPTCDSDNQYPEISQGLPKCEKDKKYGEG